MRRKNQTTHPDRQQRSAAAVGTVASSALILPELAAGIPLRKSESIDRELMAELLSSIREVYDWSSCRTPGATLAKVFETAISGFLETCEPQERPKNRYGDDIIDIWPSFVSCDHYNNFDGSEELLPAFLLTAANRIPICECGKRLRELRDISPSLPGYLMHLLDRSPVFVFTPRCHLAWMQEMEWMTDGDFSGWPSDDEERKSDISLRRLERELPKWTHSREHSPGKFPEEISGTIDAFRTVCDRLYEMKELYSLCGYMDLPAAWICLDEEDPVCDWIRDYFLENANSGDEVSVSPVAVPARLPAQRLRQVLTDYFQAAALLAEILVWLDSELPGKWR